MARPRPTWFAAFGLGGGKAVACALAYEAALEMGNARSLEFCPFFSQKAARQSTITTAYSGALLKFCLIRKNLGGHASEEERFLLN